MSLQYVDLEEILQIHSAIIKRAGTKASVRDFGLLHSAAERPRASFGGDDLYPTLLTKAAALLQSMAMNHPFSDGNKRTAWLATKRFLYLNGYHLKSKGKEAADFMVAVDNEKLDLGQISTWLKKHSKKI